MPGIARDHIRFLLNDREIRLHDVDPRSTLLDYLRTEQRLTGTKEGCAEGDCGACTVLIGRLSDGQLRYRTCTSCIRFLGSLDGCHVVTIEHLKRRDGSLHPVQQAMVDEHGSQCGFCTPGIVMSLYALWLSGIDPKRPDIEKALQGNLCRCTGYEPIIRAAEAMCRTVQDAETDGLVAERAAIIERLRGLEDGARVEIGEGERMLIRPTDLGDLTRAYADHPAATVVAGATDVGLWVTKQMREIGPVIFTDHLAELQRVTENDAAIILGAGVTYTDAAERLSVAFPTLGYYLDRIGGEQIRNMGTIGGNIANGSPIGDMPPVLIALGTVITLNHGGERRRLRLEDFFIDYGKQDRTPGEIVETIEVPKLGPGGGRHFAAYKISKRRDEDISALAGAFNIGVVEGFIEEARIAFGGMAATPKRALHVEAALIGKPWSEATIDAALQAFESDYQPLSDWRASSAYRMLTAKNLLKRFWLEEAGEAVTLKRFEQEAAE